MWLGLALAERLADVRAGAAALFASFRKALLAEQDRWGLWLPVLFGAGAAAYLSLALEPSLAAACLLPASCAAALFLSRRRPGLLIVLWVAAIVAAGFAAASLRSHLAAAPILPERERAYDVEGGIEARELREGGRTRLTLRVISLGKDMAAPYRVRVTAPSARAATFGPGDAVRLTARLRGPPGPVMPGGYDFARTAWFDRIGGLGYAISDIARIESPPQIPWSIAAMQPVERLRATIGARILAVIPGETGDIAKALINGDRAGISEETNAAMRDSGLYHVISISGLHMVIVGGTLFFLVRALLATSATLATRYPIKKMAAVAALFGAAFYLLLSGGSAPTQRAWIMITIAFIAILLDRQAISMRTVAVAAFAILIVGPESVADVSFQMSFAAVVALVAFYEWMRDRRGGRREAPAGAMRYLRPVWVFVFGAALTTLIAGTAVTPFSIHHFQNAQHYAIVANVLASPVITALIMPAGLISVVAMPFGLEAAPLHAMAYGVDLMLAIAHMVSSWPGAVSAAPRTPLASLALIALGGLWICLWRGRIRLGGTIPIALGLALSPTMRAPDVLIDRDGRIVAVRGADGALAPSPVRASNYTVARWLAADGDGRETEQAVTAAGGAQICDARGCVAKLGADRVALVRHVSALEEDCRTAAIVIAPFPASRRCQAPIVIDGTRLRRRGAHALYRERRTYRIVTAADLRGRRPWSMGGVDVRSEARPPPKIDRSSSPEAARSVDAAPGSARTRQIQ
jgi:competence protein ComEC